MNELKLIGFRVEMCQRCGKSFGTGAPHYLIPKHECKPTKEWMKKQKEFFAGFEKQTNRHKKSIKGRKK